MAALDATRLSSQVMVKHVQSMQALSVANDRRIEVSAFKKQIRAMPADQGALYVADLLRQDHEMLSSIDLETLLTSIRTVGKAAAHRLMRIADCPYGAMAGSHPRRGRQKRRQPLSQRRQNLMADALERRVARVRARREIEQ